MNTPGKVVIIGAGPAGLTAAHTMLKRAEGTEVIVLEESDAIGGISRTVQYKGNRMDLGGHRFFSKDENVMSWWKEIMPMQGAQAYDDKILGREKPLTEGGPNPETEDRVMLTRQRVSRIFYDKKFFDYPISMKPQTFINMGFLNTVRAGCSYLYSVVHKLPEDSLENFYINRFGKVLYSMFFEGYTEKLWGRHPREIAADWGAQRVKGLSILAIIKDMFSKLLPGKRQREVETSLIEEFLYPKHGPGQLWETVADEIEQMGGTVRKNASVREIILEGNKVKKLIFEDTATGKREEIEGAVFLSSMPVKDLVEGIRYQEAAQEIPKNVKSIATGLPYRDYVTVGLLVDKLNLKNGTKIKTLNNIVPDSWIYVQDTHVKLGRIQIFNNWSPYLVKDIENTVWIGLEYFCKEGDTFWNLSPSKAATFGTKELIKMGIIDSKENVLDFHKEKVKKAYPAYFDTYKDIEQVISWLDEIENLYCIGRNGQHRYNNMDHSMVTSFEAVNNILTGRKDKSNIWNVNTEQEYHENK